MSPPTRGMTAIAGNMGIATTAMVGPAMIPRAMRGARGRFILRMITQAIAAALQRTEAAIPGVIWPEKGTSRHAVAAPAMDRTIRTTGPQVCTGEYGEFSEKYNPLAASRGRIPRNPICMPIARSCDPSPPVAIMSLTTQLVAASPRTAAQTPSTRMLRLLVLLMADLGV